MSATSEVPQGDLLYPADLAQRAAKYWWLFLIGGIIFVLYGMLVLSMRPTTLWSLSILIGITFIFGGVGQFFAAQRAHSWQWLFYVGGALGILAGIMAFVWPGATLFVLAVFVSWYLVISGIFHVVEAFMGPKGDWWWVQIVLGVVEFILGMWAIASPGRELLLLINLIGIYLIFYGVTEIFAAFAARSLRDSGPLQTPNLAA